MSHSNILYSYDDILDSTFSQDSFNEVIDADGCCVLPGLVDAHTHPVWSGDRVHEFSMKVSRERESERERERERERD